MKVLLLRTITILVLTLVGVILFSSTAHAAPQTFTVTSTADDSAVAPATGCTTVLPDCTLRSAIEAANANGNPGDIDVIEFNIGGGGHQVITPAAVFDNIIEPVNINGETQPGSSCGNLVPSIPSGSNTPHSLNIEIDDSASWFWFDATSAGSIVRGLNIHSGVDNTWINIVINASNMTVECNYLGTDIAGTSIPANAAGTAILVNDPLSGTLIQNNLISGNQGQGIYFNGSGIIQNNLIGTDTSGTSALANSIGINANDNTDNVTIDTNVISGNNSAVLKNSASQLGTPDFIITNNNVGLNLAGGSLPNSFAIDIRYVQSAIITSNTSDNNVQTGIQVLFGHSVTATTNNASGNVAGIYATGTNQAGDTANLSSNITNNNGSTGIFVDDFDTIQATNNTSTGNTTDGMDIHADSIVTISNNNISNNTQNGINSSGTGGQTNDNTTNSNGSIGLFTTGNTYNNTSNNNGSSGILAANLANVHNNMMDGNDIGLSLNGSDTTINNNTIINNTSNGVEINGGDNNVITSNYIGIESNGNLASNGGNGIFVIGTNSVVIGGSSSAQRNYISGNNGNGIQLFACGTNVTQGVIVIGNYIGTNITGSIQSGYGNGFSGITINEQDLVGCGGGGGGGGSLYKNVIGGDNAGEQNTIAGNGRDGIRIFQAPNMDVFSNAILPNTIYGNTNLGVNLAADTTNSGSADADLGPNALNNFLLSIPSGNANNYLNHPIINNAVYNGNQLTVEYSYNANQADNSTLFQSNVIGYRLDFYINDNAQDGAYAGYNQGKTHVGYFIVSGSENNASHTFTTPITLSDNQSINAEATILWANPGPP